MPDMPDLLAFPGCRMLSAKLTSAPKCRGCAHDKDGGRQLGHPRDIGPGRVEPQQQRLGVLRPSDKSPHLGNFGQVRRVQASNRTATDNADSLDQIISADEPRQALLGDAIKAIPALRGALHGETLKKAIDEHNNQVLRPRRN